MTGLAGAYSASAAAWAEGPARVYRTMARELVGRCPGGVAGRDVLDLGAGTGVAGRVALDAGARRVVSVDAAVGMVRAIGAGVVGDARALPLAARSFDAVIAAFSLNHVDDPGAGLREAGRALRPGGGIVAGAYAGDDGHPVKAAVDAAASALGWEVPAWYATLRADVIPLLATVDGACRALDVADLDGHVERVDVAVPGIDAAGLVAWRLGMAQVAPFVADLDAADRARLVADALDRLGADPPPLVRRVIVITATR
jgi:SAM-dependent methyltransferase